MGRMLAEQEIGRISFRRRGRRQTVDPGPKYAQLIAIFCCALKPRSEAVERLCLANQSFVGAWILPTGRLRRDEVCPVNR